MGDSIEEFNSVINNASNFLSSTLVKQITDIGTAICVLDNAFVYVGNLIIGRELSIIQSAKNIRIYGTTKGLGQLAIEGPQKQTVLDDAGTVCCFNEELKHFILTDISLWK